MKLINIILVFIIFWQTPCYGEEIYSVSRVLNILSDDSASIVGNEILLSSCGIAVLECNWDDRHSHVLHIDNIKAYKSKAAYEEVRKNKIMVFGTPEERKLGRRIGNKRCGIYKGYIEKNPFPEYKQSYPFIFTVTKIVNQYKRDIRKEIKALK